VPRANTAFAEAAKVIEETLDDVKAKTDVSFTHG
jgi:hypothetical protein